MDFSQRPFDLNSFEMYLRERARYAVLSDNDWKNFFLIYYWRRKSHARIRVKIFQPLTSLSMRWTNVHLDFQNDSKNYFTSIPSDLGLGTENPRSLGVKAIFAIFPILKFSAQWSRKTQSRYKIIFRAILKIGEDVFPHAQTG